MNKCSADRIVNMPTLSMDAYNKYLLRQKQMILFDDGITRCAGEGAGCYCSARGMASILTDMTDRYFYVVSLYE